MLPCHKAKHLLSSTYWQEVLQGADPRLFTLPSGVSSRLAPAACGQLSISLPTSVLYSAHNYAALFKHLKNIYREIKSCTCNIEVMDVFLCSLR